MNIVTERNMQYIFYELIVKETRDFDSCSFR